MKKIFTILTALLISACEHTPNIIGTWTEPVPNMPEMVQGFTLHPNGTATSVNMATLQYTNWEIGGDKLILTGRSIGNHQTIEFRDVYEIEYLSHDTLTLRNGEYSTTYTQQE